MNYSYKPTRRSIDCNLCLNEKCLCRTCRGKEGMCILEYESGCSFSENNNCTYLKEYPEYIMEE